MHCLNPKAQGTPALLNLNPECLNPKATQALPRQGWAAGPAVATHPRAALRLLRFKGSVRGLKETLPDAHNHQASRP